MPPDVALANTPFTFYNCSARTTYVGLMFLCLALYSLIAYNLSAIAFGCFHEK